MSNDKMREAIIESSDFYFSERSPMVDTADRRNVYSAAFAAGANWQSAVTQQPESEPQCSVCDNDGLNCNFCGYNPNQSPKQVPSERGANRFGLDMAYFRNLINRELNSHSLDNYKPSELARVFARMAAAADRDVLREPEFGRPQPTPQVPEGWRIEQDEDGHIQLQKCDLGVWVFPDGDRDERIVWEFLSAVLNGEQKPFPIAAPSIADKGE